MNRTIRKIRKINSVGSLGVSLPKYDDRFVESEFVEIIPVKFVEKEYEYK